MFHSARIKLTAWYLAIIMAISILFSFIIYSNVNQEFSRIEEFQLRVRERLERGYPVRLRDPEDAEVLRIDPEMINQARLRLVTMLAIINATIFGLAGAAGYFLAGRTLKPIKEMVDEQHRFVADASHELRTPLTSLRSEIEVNLRNKKMTLADAKRLLQSNLEDVVSLQELSDRLLDLAQTESPTTHALYSTFLLSSVLERAVKKLDGQLQQKAITVTQDVGQRALFGREDDIWELFIILLDNAIKYSPQGSTITVKARKQKDVLTITVADQGIGIAEEDIPHIFERFYRASKSREKGNVPGYGLGLSIAKKIMEEHNGEITVASTLGKGTVFSLRFPEK